MLRDRTAQQGSNVGLKLEADRGQCQKDQMCLKTKGTHKGVLEYKKYKDLIIQVCQLRFFMSLSDALGQSATYDFKVLSNPFHHLKGHKNNCF